MNTNQTMSRRAMLAGIGSAGLAIGLGATVTRGAGVTDTVYGRPGHPQHQEQSGCMIQPAGFTYDDVQAALDAGAGKTVLFPAGTYVLTGGTPIIHSHTRVIACGHVVVVQPQTGKAAAFATEPGSTHIVIEGFDIRGPWYGTGVPAWVNGDQDTALWNSAYAENIGIDLRGRWYQRQILRYSRAQMEALTDESADITVYRCRIEGFGQSGIIADNVTRFAAEGNHIQKCGRDGIRMYGVVDGYCAANHVQHLAPGMDGAKPNYNVYGITATRLYGSSSVPDPQSTIGRPSQHVVMCHNVIEDTPTWKGLDTHGGIGISFLGNTVRNAYIAIGIDKGGINAVHGYAPGKDLIIAGNRLYCDADALYRRAGITAYGHDDSEVMIGRNLVISGNTIAGCGGQPTDGAISVSNFSGVTISGNVITGSLRAALNVWNTVHDFSFTGNIVDGVDQTIYQVSYGVLVQTKRGSGVINNNTFRSRGPAAWKAGISLQEPEEGFGVKVGADNVFHGAMLTKVNPIVNEAGGSYALTPVAYADIDVAASGAVLLAAKGVLGVERVQLGEVRVTLQQSRSGAFLIPQVTVKQGGAAAAVSNVTATSFHVSMTDSAGAPVDCGCYVTVLG